MTQPALSVVVAWTGQAAAEEVLKALRAGCEGIRIELILAHTRVHRLPPGVEGFFSDWRAVARPATSLVPVLWGAGVQLARAPVVALTTDQMRVRPGWAPALLEGLASGAQGVAGPIELASEADGPTAVAFLTRFSAFLPQAWPAVARARDIPGDNAAYRADALRRHEDLLAEGMWETEFHRRFEREGGYLLMVPGARAALTTAEPLRSLLRQRYRHAQRFGAARMQRHGRSRLRLLGAAPAVPLVLLARIWRRTRPRTRERRLVLRYWPWLALAAGAWAAGEAAGALHQKGSRDG